MKPWIGAILAGWLALPAFAETATLALPGGQEITLPAGGLIGVAGPGMVLTLTRVNDQRCPTAFDCYWEGLIRVVIAIKVEGFDPTFVIMCNSCEDGDREAAVAGYRLALDHLEPDHAVIEQLGRAAVLADYTAVVTVSAAP